MISCISLAASQVSRLPRSVTIRLIMLSGGLLNDIW